MWFIEGFCDGKIILYYFDGCNVIIRVFVIKKEVEGLELEKVLWLE